MKNFITYFLLSVFLLSCTRDVIVPMAKPEKIKPVITKSDLIGTWQLSGNTGGMGAGAGKEVMFDKNDSIKIRETDEVWCIDTSNWYAIGTYGFVESDSTLNLALFLQIKNCIDSTYYDTVSVPYKIVSHAFNKYNNYWNMLIININCSGDTFCGIYNNPLMYPSSRGSCTKPN